jgi:hypothetical protein
MQEFKSKYCFIPGSMSLLSVMLIDGFFLEILSTLNG